MTLMIAVEQTAAIDAAIRQRFERFAEDEGGLVAAPTTATMDRAALLIAYCSRNRLEFSYAFGNDGSVGVCFTRQGLLEYFDFLNDGRIRYYCRNRVPASQVIEAVDAELFLYRQMQDRYAAYFNSAPEAVAFMMPVASGSQSSFFVTTDC